MVALEKLFVYCLPALDMLELKKDEVTSSIVIEVIRIVSFIYERYFKCKKQKQKHLSNMQPDISKQKSTNKST